MRAMEGWEGWPYTSGDMGPEIQQQTGDDCRSEDFTWPRKKETLPLVDVGLAPQLACPQGRALRAMYGNIRKLVRNCSMHTGPH